MLTYLKKGAYKAPVLIYNIWKEKYFLRSYMKSDNSITTLDRIKAESYCVIKTVSLRDDIKARFSEMGLVPETLVYVKKRAPLGDPMEICVRGYSLCIRNTDAEHISVDRLKGTTAAKTEAKRK